jgi:hypothetical protein
MCHGIGRLAGVGLEAVFRKNYIDSYIAQFDLRLSDEAKLTSKKINNQLRNPESFAEYINELKGVDTELLQLKTNKWVKGRKLSSEAINMDFAQDGKYPPYLFESIA